MSLSSNFDSSRRIERLLSRKMDRAVRQTAEIEQLRFMTKKSRCVKGMCVEISNSAIARCNADSRLLTAELQRPSERHPVRTDSSGRCHLVPLDSPQNTKLSQNWVLNSFLFSRLTFNHDPNPRFKKKAKKLLDWNHLELDSRWCFEPEMQLFLNSYPPDRLVARFLFIRNRIRLWEAVQTQERANDTRDMALATRLRASEGGEPANQSEGSMRFGYPRRRSAGLECLVQRWWASDQRRMSAGYHAPLLRRFVSVDPVHGISALVHKNVFSLANFKIDCRIQSCHHSCNHFLSKKQTEDFISSMYLSIFWVSDI